MDNMERFAVALMCIILAAITVLIVTFSACAVGYLVISFVGGIA